MQDQDWLIRLLNKYGIPAEEIFRILATAEPQQDVLEWPGPIIGLDLMPQINPIQVPDTGSPPYFQPNTLGSTEPYPTIPTPDPLGAVKTNDPLYYKSGSNIGRTYQLENPPYQGDDRNWAAIANVPYSQPSMHGEHGYNVTMSIPPWRYDIEQSQMAPVEMPPIAIPPSGTVIQEALAQVRQEFGWLTNEYLGSAKELAEQSGGKLYLIRASQEAITDHRSEGEEFRRKLDGFELMAMARTAIRRGMDINHNPSWRTLATIVDSEYDPMTKSIQMLIIEKDPEINKMIENGQITAVSINGGSPRTETIEPCDHLCSTSDCELCNVPRGVILGEQDDIGLTWVITDPNGVMWHGTFIAFAEPGVKTTIIQPI